MRSLKKISKWILGFVLVYVGLECIYRVYRYEALEFDNPKPAKVNLSGPANATGVVESVSDYARYARSNISSFESPLDILDTETGFMYKPNTHVHQRLYDVDGNLLPHISTINTNNFGLISSADTVIAKPATEYRIAILGDSFCATTTSSTPWPLAFEGILNGDSVLKNLTGKTTFKVLDFCLDGTGLVQWPAVYKYKAEQFQPDLVIVNFIWDDLFRKFMYRDTIGIAGDHYAMISCSALPVTLANPHCQSASCFVMDPDKEDYRIKSSRIKREIYDLMVRRLPWFAPYPELLATVLKGRFGLQPRLVVQSQSSLRYKNPEEAVAAIGVGLDSLRKIASMHPKMMVLFHPTIEECRDRQTPPVVQRFMERAKDFNVVNMLNVLPLGAGETEIQKWYNVPYDAHPSDYGAEVYAHAVRGELLAYLTKEKSSHSESEK
jgi:hypothetical protein